MYPSIYFQPPQYRFHPLFIASFPMMLEPQSPPEPELWGWPQLGSVRWPLTEIFSQPPRLTAQQGGSPVTVSLPQSAARLHGLGWSSKDVSAKGGLPRQIPNHRSSIRHSHITATVQGPEPSSRWWHGTSLQPPAAKSCSALVPAAPHLPSFMKPLRSTARIPYPLLHPCVNGEWSISCNLPGVLLTDGLSSLAAKTNTRELKQTN